MKTALDVGVNPERAAAASSCARRRRISPLTQFVAVLLLVASPLAARADGDAPLPVAPPPTDPPKVEFIVTPYLWLPWTTVNVRPNNPALSGRSVTIGPGKLITHLNWIPFMGEAEVRSGDYGAIFDYIHAPTTAGISTRGILFGSGSSGVTINTGTAMFLYRPITRPNQYLDVGVGVRVWSIDTQVSFTQGILPPVSLSGGALFADPLFGARYHYEFGGGYSATAYGDIGGGAGSSFDWQLVGAVEYKNPGWPVLSAGFRSLNFSYKGPLARFSTYMYGPFLSSTFRF